MTRQMTLQQVTRLAVTIVIEDETGTLAFSLLLVTGILAVWEQLGRWGSSLFQEIDLVASDIREAVVFTYKVLSIAAVSLEYGLGLSR